MKKEEYSEYNDFEGSRFNLLLIITALKEYSTPERPISTREIVKYIYDDCKAKINKSSVDRILEQAYQCFSLDNTEDEEPNSAVQYFGFGLHKYYNKNGKYVKESLLNDFEESNKNLIKYYSIENTFNPNEIKMLADAIEVYSYITAKETANIINKLNKLQAKKYRLKYVAYRETAIKRENINTGNSINIFEAISKFRKIIEKKEKAEIIYGFYNENKKLVERKGYPQVISPYYLMWSNGYYYLIAKSSRHEELVNYRVDRFIDVKEMPGIKADELKDDEHKFTNSNGSFSSTKYRENHAVMYSGIIEDIELECRSYMVNTLIDSFGSNIRIQKIDEGWIKVNFKSSIDGVVLWATQYCSDSRAIYPPLLVSKVKERLKKGIENYSDDI